MLPNKYLKPISLLFALAILMSSCSSTTLIQSEPPGARLYLNGVAVGNTPYYMTDTKIVGSCTSVRLEMPGHETLNTQICRDEEADVGAIVGGIFFLIPFLWTMAYQPNHYYDLRHTDGQSAEPLHEYVPESNNRPNAPRQETYTKSKAEKLRELKALLDEGILTQEEFEIEKQKILDEN